MGLFIFLTVAIYYLVLNGGSSESSPLTEIWAFILAIICFSIGLML